MPGLFGQIVSLPGGPVGPPVAIRPTLPAGFDFKGGVAYSSVDHVFLVAVGESPFNMVNNGRLPTRIVRLNSNAQPVDDLQLSLEAFCPNLEFEFACNHVDVVWTPSRMSSAYFMGKLVRELSPASLLTAPF